MEVCLATKEFNVPYMEPDDVNQIDTILNGVRLAIARHRSACPGFDRQLQQHLQNKEREISRNNICWNCGQPGHRDMRSRCLHPRRHLQKGLIVTSARLLRLQAPRGSTPPHRFAYTIPFSFPCFPTLEVVIC